MACRLLVLLDVLGDVFVGVLELVVGDVLRLDVLRLGVGTSKSGNSDGCAEKGGEQGLLHGETLARADRRR